MIMELAMPRCCCAVFAWTGIEYIWIKCDRNVTDSVFDDCLVLLFSVGSDRCCWWKICGRSGSVKWEGFLRWFPRTDWPYLVRLKDENATVFAYRYGKYVTDARQVDFLRQRSFIWIRIGSWKMDECRSIIAVVIIDHFSLVLGSVMVDHFWAE